MGAKTAISSKEGLLISFIGLSLWSCYLIAALFPESMWGLHHVAFLGSGFKFVYLSISFVLIMLGMVPLTIPKIQWEWNVPSMLTASFVMGVIYYSFPFYATLTGDAELFNSKLGVRTTEYQPLYLEKLLSLNILHPKTGNTTVLSGIRLISYSMDISHREAYRLVGAVSGMLYVFIWLRFVQKLKLTNASLLIASGLGLLMPFTQFFFGYEEIYAPAYPLLLAFLFIHIGSLQNQNNRLLVLQFVLLILCMKIHSVFVLLAPSFLLSVLYAYDGNRHLFTWQKMALVMLLPITVAGILVYFFVTKSYNDPRFVGPDVNIYERLFLPILSPKAPLDRYNMFSWNHLVDYCSIVFQWFGPVLFLVLSALIVLRKRIDWNRPEMLTVGLSGCLFLIIFFAYNPLMSMPLDYDLFSLPAPVFLVFGLLLFSQLKNSPVSKTIGFSSLALGLLVIPIFQVNATKTPLSYRSESVGIHVFKTYWIRSAGDIGSAIQLLESNDSMTVQRYVSAIKELEPYANKGNDAEYANLIWQLAKHFRVKAKDYAKALEYHTTVLDYDSSLAANYIGLMECNYMLQRYDEAHYFSKKLIEFNYPSEEKALRIAIECASLAGNQSDLAQHCRQFLSKWDDKTIEEVYLRLSE